MVFEQVTKIWILQPTPEQDPDSNDYDSAESGADEAEDSGSDCDDDDIFDTSKVKLVLFLSKI